MSIAWSSSTLTSENREDSEVSASISFPELRAELPSLVALQAQSWDFFLGRVVLLDPVEMEVGAFCHPTSCSLQVKLCLGSFHCI